MSTQAWFPDDQHGYSIALCECKEGPYLGARQMGTPCVCERCRRITADQWEFLLAHVKAEALRDAADYCTPKNWTGPSATLIHLNHWLNVTADRLVNAPAEDETTETEEQHP